MRNLQMSFFCCGPLDQHWNKEKDWSDQLDWWATRDWKNDGWLEISRSALDDLDFSRSLQIDASSDHNREIKYQIWIEKNLKFTASGFINFLVESAGTWTAGKCFHFYFRVLPELAKGIPLSRPKRRSEAGTQGLIQIRLKSGYCSLSRSLFWPPDAAQIPPEKKIWCSKLSEISWKIQMLQKLSNFFRISTKKLLELSWPSLSISTSSRLLFFITRFWRAEKKPASIFEWETCHQAQVKLSAESNNFVSNLDFIFWIIFSVSDRGPRKLTPSNLQSPEKSLKITRISF
jgi:hypothetical protein